MSAVQRSVLLLILGIALGLVATGTARAASISVSPTSIPAGGTVTVSGDVLAPGGQAGCALPGTVSLFSDAFGDPNTPQTAPAGADAHFGVQVTIPTSVAPGTYTITGRCGGGNLGVQATLVVTPALPATGTGDPVQDGNAEWQIGSIIVGLALVLSLLGLPATSWLRRGT